MTPAAPSSSWGLAGVIAAGCLLVSVLIGAGTEAIDYAHDRPLLISDQQQQGKSQ